MTHTVNETSHLKQAGHTDHVAVAPVAIFPIPPIGPQQISSAQLAMRDITDGLRRWQIWGRMGWQDIKQRYRRSALGPFWLTLSMGIMIGSLGFLYARLFKMEIHDYLPFLCVGLLAWGLISTILIEGCTVFIVSEPLIKQIKLPLTTYLYRLIWRNLIVFVHNFVVYAVVAVIFGVRPGATALFVIPGLVLLVFNTAWLSLLLGLVCTRFRDVPPIVLSLVQVVFFLTPIFWKPESLGPHAGFVHLNLFYELVELVRGPLLGQAPEPITWMITSVIAVLGSGLAFLVFARFRSRLAYWL